MVWYIHYYNFSYRSWHNPQTQPKCPLCKRWPVNVDRNHAYQQILLCSHKPDIMMRIAIFDSRWAFFSKKIISLVPLFRIHFYRLRTCNCFPDYRIFGQFLFSQDNKFSGCGLQLIRMRAEQIIDSLIIPIQMQMLDFWCNRPHYHFLFRKIDAIPSIIIVSTGAINGMRVTLLSLM